MQSENPSILFKLISDGNHRQNHCQSSMKHSYPTYTNKHNRSLNDRQKSRTLMVHKQKHEASNFYFKKLIQVKLNRNQPPAITFNYFRDCFFTTARLKEKNTQKKCHYHQMKDAVRQQNSHCQKTKHTWTELQSR